MGDAWKQRDGWKKYGQWVVFFLITAAFLMVQSGRIMIPPGDCFEEWRQTDTYSIAQNFVQFNMNPLRPQLNYDGLANNYAQLELQIMPFISAVIFQLTGTMTPAVCRVLSLMFFVGSGVFLYLLMRDFAGRLPALVGYAMYLFLPLSLLMASSIQPEACALFFYCAGVYFLRRYHLTGKYRFLAAASAMTAVAIMEKTPVAFVGLLFLYVLLSVMGKGFYKNPWFYGCGAITLLPPIALILYTSHHSVFRFVDGIASKHVLTKEIFSLFTKAGVTFFYGAFTTCFGWAAIVLAVLGMLRLVKKENRFVLAWTISFALECATVVAVIKFKYYLVFVLPICAILAALAVKDLIEYRRSVAAVACGFMVLSLGLRGTEAWKTTQESALIREAGEFIAENTQFEDGVAIGALSPAYLNAANRRGYRANLQYYDYIPTQPSEEIAYFIDHGVRWMVVLNGSVVYDTDGSYLAYVQATYPVYATSEHCVIYDLQPEGSVER